MKMGSQMVVQEPMRSFMLHWQFQPPQFVSPSFLRQESFLLASAWRGRSYTHAGPQGPRDHFSQLAFQSQQQRHHQSLPGHASAQGVAAPASWPGLQAAEPLHGTPASVVRVLLWRLTGSWSRPACRQRSCSCQLLTCPCTHSMRLCLCASLRRSLHESGYHSHCPHSAHRLASLQHAITNATLAAQHYVRTSMHIRE